MVVLPTALATVQAFSLAQSWQLSQEQCLEYAQILQRSEAVTQTEQELVLTYFHHEQHLVRALQDMQHPNHGAAIAEVQAQCLQTIRTYKYHWKKDEALSEEDICQTVLLKMLEKIELFKYRSAFRTWLTRIIINESLQMHRRQNTQSRAAEQESLEFHTGLQSQQESVVTIAINNVERFEFASMLSQQADQRLLTIFSMYVDQDATLKQIGEQLQLQPSRVHALLEIVRRLLRNFRGEDQDNQPEE